MTWDVIVVGAGAAGLATAIFTRSRRPEASVLLLDGARKPGAKILVSGGGRCNVTNTVVTERDYLGRAAGDRSPCAARADGCRHGQVLRRRRRSAARGARRQALSRLEQRAPGARRAARTRSGQRRRVALVASRLHAGEDCGRLSRGHERGRAPGAPRRPRDGRIVAAEKRQRWRRLRAGRALGHTIVATTPALAPLVLSAQRQRMRQRPTPHGPASRSR